MEDSIQTNFKVLQSTDALVNTNLCPLSPSQIKILGGGGTTKICKVDALCKALSSCLLCPLDPLPPAQIFLNYCSDITMAGGGLL